MYRLFTVNDLDLLKERYFLEDNYYAFDFILTF